MWVESKSNFTVDDSCEPFDVPCPYLEQTIYVLSHGGTRLVDIQGLQLYGREETFISLKSQMA